MTGRKETEGAKIVRQLRLEILFGHLQPGQILSQEDLCLRFETSRMPVRDALLQLAHEGFLERLSGHRLRVVKLERIDFLDMIWIEATVHALAVKRATERHSSDVGPLCRWRHEPSGRGEGRLSPDDQPDGRVPKVDIHSQERDAWNPIRFYDRYTGLVGAKRTRPGRSSQRDGGR
jgi:DNA-binding transcriptional MocR family regulator